jgi:amidase
MPEFVFSTASQLAHSIRSREVSSVEVIEAHLDRIRKHNFPLNAIATLNEEQARERAREADAALARGEIWGPLHGVPVTIKDSFETEALTTTSSYKPLARYRPRQDATVVARVRAAGAILLAKTNLPELALDIQSASPIFGRANNPWDLERTPGGSTGGGAAAVAAGLSPLEIGSDIGGSIRIPSHFCGLFGFKPTEHRVPQSGHIPGLPGDPKTVRHMAVFGPLARSVEDLKLCLSVIYGPDGRDWEVPPVPFEEGPDRPLEEAAFAWTDEFGGVPVTADTRSALEKVAQTLSVQGCRVERLNPPGFDFTAAWRAFGEIVGTETGANLPLPLRVIGALAGPILSRKDPLFCAMMRGFRLDMRRYMKALTLRDSLIGALERFLGDRDAWICPVSATPAFKHKRPAARLPGQPIEVDGLKIPYWVAGVSYTSVFNLTGNPVVVLPVARSAEGLPIGVQVVGRRWQDMRLLALAQRVADVTGPFQPPPGY